MGRALGERHQLERQDALGQQLERAVLGVGLVEPVQAQHHREQRQHPDHADADARQDLGRGADAEREQRRGDDEEQQRLEAVAAAPQPQAQVAPQDREEGAGHGASSSTERVVDRDVAVGRQHDDAAACAMRGERLLEARAVGGVEPDARLVEQPERARGREQPGERQAAALAGREVARRHLGEMAEVEARERGLDAGRRRAARAPRRRPGSRAP